MSNGDLSNNTLRLDLVQLECSPRPFRVSIVTRIPHIARTVRWVQGDDVLNMSPSPWKSARTSAPSAANTLAL